MRIRTIRFTIQWKRPKVWSKRRMSRQWATLIRASTIALRYALVTSNPPPAASVALSQSSLAMRSRSRSSWSIGSTGTRDNTLLSNVSLTLPTIKKAQWSPIFTNSVIMQSPFAGTRIKKQRYSSQSTVYPPISAPKRASRWVMKVMI